jgi:hypothetical protein
MTDHSEKTLRFKKGAVDLRNAAHGIHMDV